MALSGTTLYFDLIARDKASAAFLRAGGAADTASAKIQRAGAKMSAVGGKLTRSVTLPVAAVGAVAVKMAGDFDASMQKINGLVGISQKQVNAWSDDILNMAKVLPQSPKELADAMFFITSAGLRGKTALDALNQSARASAGGLGDTATVADAVTSAMNAYGPKVLSAGKATDILTAAVREGKLEASSLAPVIGKTIPIAKAMGVSFAEVAGSMALMSKSGANAAQAGTQVTSVIGSFAKPSATMIKALGTMHLTLDQVRNSLANRGLVPTLADLRDKAKKAGIDLSQVFANKRALTGVLQLTDNLKNTDAVMKGVANSTGSTDKAFKSAAQTANFKFKAAMSSLQVAMIQLGNKLLPVVTSGVNKLVTALDWFSRQPDWFKNLAGGGVLFLAVLGPMLSIVGNLTRLYGGLVKILETLGVVQKATTASQVAATAATGEQAAATTGLSVAMSRLRFGAAIGGITALAASSRTGSGALTDLLQVGGSIATGFAVGGPIGAAVGAAAGAFLVLSHHMGSADSAAQFSRADYSKLGDTLDNLTGSVTANTREFIKNQLAQSGTLKNLASYGITTRQAISAVLGEGKARQQVTAAIRNQMTASKAQARQEIANLRAINVAEGKAGTLDPKVQAARLARIKQLQAEIAQEKNQRKAILEGIGATKSAILQKRRDIAATTDYTGKLKGLSQGLRQDVITNGIIPTTKYIAALSKQYNATPKQINTLIKASGVDTTVKQVQRVEANMAAVSKLKPDLSAYKSSLGAQLDQAGGIARSGGTAIGNALGSGLQTAVHGWAGSIATTSADLVSNAIRAARQAANAHSPSRKMIALGIDMVDGLRLGLMKGEVPLSKVVDRVLQRVQALGSKLKSDVGARNSFASGFQSFATSAFGADFGTDPTTGSAINPTVGGILAYQRQQRDQARMVNKDVHKLVKMGLSPALIKQLQAAGPSGLAEIQALAGATPAQIRQYNALNKQTTSSLHSAGMVAGNAIYGDKIREDRQHYREEKHLLREIRDELKRGKKGEELVARIDGGDLIIAIRHTQRKKGQKPTV